MGAELSNWGEVRVGLRRGNGSSRVLIGDPALPTGDFDLGGAFVQFGYDRLDSAYFPKQGQAFRASWLADRESLGATRDADIVRASWQLARSRGRYSVVWSMDGGSALDDEVVSPQELFTLGGLFDLSGLPPDARVGHAVRHRARDRLSPHQPRRHGVLRVPGVPRVSRSRPATSGPRGTTSTSATSRPGAACSSARKARSARCTWRPAWRVAARRAFYLYLGKTF